MRDQLSRALRGLAVFGAASLFALANAQTQELLVRTADSNSVTTQAATAAFGQIVGQDASTGLYRLRLNKGLNAEATKKQLLNSSKLRIAINSHPQTADRTNYQSVSDHTIYLEEIQRHSDGLHAYADLDSKLSPHAEKEAADYWAAYRYWMKDRVDSAGRLRLDYLQRAAQHRDLMPIARSGSTTSGGAVPQLISGTWSFVGPKNTSTTDGGGLYFGPTPVAGRVNAIAVDPTNANIIYIASPGGGVVKTTNGGTTWTPLSDGSTWPMMQVSSLAIDPANHNTIYAGTGDYAYFGFPGFGVMKSTDGGSTWHNYGGTQFNGLAISRIIVDPTNSNIVVATAGRGSSGGGGVFVSTSAGTTWTAVANTVGPYYDGLDISKSGVYWAIGIGPTGAYMFTSSDHGGTWVAATSPVPNTQHNAVAIACSKLSAGTIYVLSSDVHGAHHIWKTTNSGGIWSDVYNGTFENGNNDYNWSQYDYDWHITTSSTTINSIPRDVIYVGLVTLVASFDGGANWSDIGLTYATDVSQTPLAVTHNDQHCVMPSPTDPNTVYVGNDGGIYRYVFNPSTSSGTFTPLNAALPISQLYKMAVHPTNASILMSGAQDNAGPGSKGDLNNWANVSFGDGGACAYDPFNPLVAYSTSDRLNIYGTNNGWSGGVQYQLSDSNTTFNGESENFVGTIALSPLNGGTTSTLFAASDHLWKNTGTLTSPSWQGDLGGQALALGGNTVRAISMCTHDIGWLYTCSDDSQIWFSQSYGSTWVGRVDDGVFTAPVTGVSANPANSYDIVAVQAGGNLGSSHIYRCPDTHAAPRTWTAANGTGTASLPDVPINCICRDPFVPDRTWYVGTDVGVFVTKDFGSTWSNLSALGLPHVQVDDLVVNPTTGYLYAATFGRGIWKIKVENTSAFAISSVVLNPTSVNGGTGSTLTVTLNQAATFGGVSVALSSDNSFATVQSSVVIPNGSVSAQVPVNTTLPSTDQVANIKAQVIASSKTAPLTIHANSIALATPTGETGDLPFTATVTLTNAAPVGGATVTFTSTNSTYLKPTKPSIVIPAGSKTGALVIYTFPVTVNVTYTLTASYGGASASRNILLVKGGLNGLGTPASLNSNANTTGTAYISGKTTVNIVIGLRSDNPALVVPSTVTVPIGSTSMTFPITTSAIGATTTAHIIATFGDCHVTKTVTLNP